MLGIMVGVSAYAEVTTSHRTVLSGDKSTLIWVKVSESKEVLPNGNYQKNFKFDTVANYFVKEEARIYMNDSVANILMNEGYAPIPDSVKTESYCLFLIKETDIIRDLAVAEDSISIIYNQICSNYRIDYGYVPVFLFLLIVSYLFIRMIIVIIIKGGKKRREKSKLSNTNFQNLGED